MPDCHEAIVVGGGPAGLATSRELVRGGIDHVVLERGDRIGYTWHNLYDSLVLHTGKHLSTLPGMPFPPRTPLFPTRRNFIDYLERYADTFQLPIETSVDVTKAERAADRWVLRTRDGRALESMALIIATGIVSNPWTPDVPGRDRFGGRVMHSAEYRRPEQISGPARADRRRWQFGGRDFDRACATWCDSYRGRPVRSQRRTTSAARRTHPVRIGPRQSLAPRRCRASDDGHWCAARPARSAAAIADGDASKCL